MGFAENVLNKIRGTPAFKPTAVDTFGNWAIEAGDIISVDNDGVVETIPIFSSDMNWNGSAQTTMSCTGNQKREIQDKQTRKENAMSSGLSSYADRKLEELADSFGVELGSVRSALDVYVKDTDGYKEANAKVIAQIKDDVSDVSAEIVLVAKKTEELESASATLSARVNGAEASINLNAQNINGVASSVATIQADVVKLQGRVDVTGVLSVKDGAITSSGPIYAPNQTISGGTLKSQDLYASRNFYLQDVKYVPTEITSTSGTVRVLGTA